MEEIFTKIIKKIGIDNDSQLVRKIDEANHIFNIKTINEIDYITYNGIQISTKDDAKDNLLVRLRELRKSYVEQN